MVDHLSRVKQLTKRLGLQKKSKSDAETGALKMSSENGTCLTADMSTVEMRKNTGINRDSQIENDDNDNVFNEDVEENRIEHKMCKTNRNGLQTPVMETNIPKIVNKRLRNVKRPLESTRSMPLSAAAIPDTERQREEKLRADVDLLCGEMVSLRQKDQDIAKSLLKLYGEIHALKVKRSCLQHQELLEEATYDAAEADELPDMCDAPHKYMSKILLNRGVTKQNLAWRRFSCS